ncbi:LamG-like jellyroll fold domain-containing protein [Microbacterium sp. 18062]|uniref:LamG-like jellyroll fold domain-containing protein n=1 Tax=Microbacterium sp. 18062 TaxID=2681410 RepID=UPI0013571EA3|nr:LamG-like jellyroll fold domain-containing protein [Microbacterium sp. 18062]
MRDATTHSRWRRGTAAIVATAVVSAGLIAGGTAPAMAAPPDPDLHYSMDDITGATVPDSSGNGWDGAISGATGIVTGAEDDSALDLDGGHVTIPRAVLDGATDLTVSTRVRWDGSSGPWQWIFGLGSDNSRYIFASPSNGDGDLRAAITRNGPGSEAIITGRGPLAAGRWATLTLTLDTDADLLTAYIDGAAVASASTDVVAGELLLPSATSAGAIGKSFYADPPFDGAIDDFRVYRSALSAGEVAALVGGDLPEIVELTRSAFEVRTSVGEAPALPATVRATYTDDVARDVPIAWAGIDPSQYAASGVFTVMGDAAGHPVTAEVTVHRGEVRIDLGTDTGEVYGGASGLLYGLYGEGMPTANLIEGMNVRTVATKAQDGSQHPGSDALEILPTLAETGGDVYLRITDWYRGFPYQWPGDTPEEKLADYRRVLDAQLDMIGEIPREQLEHLVIEPFNEPEGNMFGTGEWSLDGTSWLTDPSDYFAAWDATYQRIREAFPDIRIAGPGTSILFPQVEGFLEHAVEAGTVPDIITWHELSHPQAIRESVATFRGWEADAFAGTAYAGTELPININEYAFNYHTSVPGQMIQWISAIEEVKVDAMIAFWNINGNLSDSAVQTNRGNGQWWLYNAYAQLSGHTVELTPSSPGENYTLQGVAALDEDAAIARTIVGGASGTAPVDLVNVPADVFGQSVRVQVREIAWTGQLGDSAQPTVISDAVVPVSDGTASIAFGSGTLPELVESSAYEIVVTPGAGAVAPEAQAPWSASYEAEDATYAGGGYSRNGPEGSPADVAKFYTSGGYDVGGLRTGSDGVLSFTVDVPEDGAYDLSVFANSLNTFAAVAENGPTNVFVTVDGAAEQEILLPLAYKWVVWDHAGTSVELTAGTHTIALAARSLDGTRATVGDAIVDRITLERSASADAVAVYEAELSDHDGDVSYEGSGSVVLDADGSATFWVYGKTDAEASLGVVGSGGGTVSVNDVDVLDLARATDAAVHLQGGVNKILVRGAAVVDAIRIGASTGALDAVTYQAEDAQRAGAAAVAELALADGGLAVEGIGGEPGNGNTLTFTVDAAEAGQHAVVVRFSNPEQVPATHYNPNPMARHADISVNGEEATQVLFVPTFHRNNFWERTVVLDLKEGENTVRFSAQEQPNFDGGTYAEENWPGIPLRADEAPIIDRITVSPLVVVATEPGGPGEPGVPGTPTPDPTLPGTGPDAPSAPAESGLTAETRDRISGPGSVARGERITVTVGTQHAGQTVYGWIYSAPTALGPAVVTATGTVTFTVPATLATGAHRLVVTDADGNVIGWYALRVTDLAATGGDEALSWIPVGALLIGAGIVLLVLRRRRTTA